jgi:hypothetical protein
VRLPTEDAFMCGSQIRNPFVRLPKQNPFEAPNEGLPYVRLPRKDPFCPRPKKECLCEAPNEGVLDVRLPNKESAGSINSQLRMPFWAAPK